MSQTSTTDYYNEIKSELEPYQTTCKNIVFTNGCFDILHIGHKRLLENAKALGDLLVVGLNSDDSIRRIKGALRPICSFAERKEMLLGLRSVDLVFEFTSDTPLELIKTVRPNTLVKGGDWEVSRIVGHDFVSSYGGTTLSLPFIDGFSTTNIIDRIVQAYGSGG